MPAMVKAARAINLEIIIMIDNTWAAGVLFKALAGCGFSSPKILGWVQ